MRTKQQTFAPSCPVASSTTLTELQCTPTEGRCIRTRAAGRPKRRTMLRQGGSSSGKSGGGSSSGNEGSGSSCSRSIGSSGGHGNSVGGSGSGGFSSSSSNSSRVSGNKVRERMRGVERGGGRGGEGGSLDSGRAVRGSGEEVGVGVVLDCEAARLGGPAGAQGARAESGQRGVIEGAL